MGTPAAGARFQGQGGSDTALTRPILWPIGKYERTPAPDPLGRVSWVRGRCALDGIPFGMRTGDMDAPPLPNSSDDSALTLWSKSFEEERQRARDFLAAHRDRVNRAQTAVSAGLQRSLEELERNGAEASQAREELDRRSEELSRQATELAKLNEELLARQAEWQKAHQESLEQYRTLGEETRRRQEDLVRREQELAAAEANLGGARKALVLGEEETKAEAEHLAALRARFEKELAELQGQREELIAAQTHTESQRRRIAQEFRTQRAAHLREIDQRRAELNRSDGQEVDRLQRQVEELLRQLDEQKGELATTRQRQLELSGALEESRQKEGEFSAQVEAARAAQ